jgi:hypothetical protein
MAHVLKNVAGVTYNIKSKEEKGASIQPVSIAKQKEALSFTRQWNGGFPISQKTAQGRFSFHAGGIYRNRDFLPERRSDNLRLHYPISYDYCLAANTTLWLRYCRKYLPFQDDQNQLPPMENPIQVSHWLMRRKIRAAGRSGTK